MPGIMPDPSLALTVTPTGAGASRYRRRPCRLQPAGRRRVRRRLLRRVAAPGRDVEKSGDGHGSSHLREAGVGGAVHAWERSIFGRGRARCQWGGGCGAGAGAGETGRRQGRRHERGGQATRAGNTRGRYGRGCDRQVRAPAAADDPWSNYRKRMEETGEGVAESAARAASDVRVVLGRLRRRLREVAGMQDLRPPNCPRSAGSAPTGPRRPARWPPPRGYVRSRWPRHSPCSTSRG